MKIWLVEAEHKEVPGRRLIACASYQLAVREEAKLRDEFGDEMEYIDITELELIQ